MKLKENIVEEVINSDIGALYKHFRQVLSQYPEDEAKKMYNHVRYGIKIKFSIHDLIDNVRLIDKGNEVVVIDPYTFDEQTVEVESFRSEIEEREDIMIECIYSNMEDGQTLGSYDD